MKKIPFLFSLLFLALPLAAEDAKPTEQKPPVEKPQKPPTAKPKPKPPAQLNTINSFYRFVRTFLMILTNPQVQNSLKGIEKLLATLMQTAYQVMQTAKPAGTPPPAPKKSSFEIDPELIQELSRSFSSHIKKTDIWRKQRPGGKMDDQTKEILANFSGVVQNFFEILRDPENAEKVPAHIIGMLAGMVNIGTIAMTKHHVSTDANYDELKAYAQSVDSEIKAEMYRIIMRTQERTGYLV